MLATNYSTEIAKADGKSFAFFSIFIGFLIIFTIYCKTKTEKL